MTSHEYIKAYTKSISPKMRYDFNEDFSLWQERSRKKLSELLGLPLKKAENDNFRIIDHYQRDELEFIRFEFQSEDNCTVACCLVKPIEKKQKLPNCRQRLPKKTPKLPKKISFLPKRKLLSQKKTPLLQIYKNNFLRKNNISILWEAVCGWLLIFTTQITIVYIL